MSNARRRPRRSRSLHARCETLESRALMSASSDFVNAGAGGFLVGFANPSAPDAAQSQTLSRIQGSIARRYASGTVLVELAPDSSVDPADALTMLKATPGVRYAEPNRTGRWDTAFDPSLPRPSGPLYKLLYGLNNSVEGANGAAPADINAPEAWRLAGVHRHSTVIAVLDSGIDAGHPDLKPNLWVNPGEIPGNGVDDENDGFIDNVHGWNTADDTSDIFDDFGHGTFVAGVAAAPFASGSGIVGADPLAKVMSIKVGSTAPTLEGVVEGINFAVNHGARVINASLTVGNERSQALEEAIRYANERGVVVVVSAGNFGTDNGESPIYPASYRFANMLSVAAVDVRGRLADFSNFGVDTVDIAAPGVDIFSTIPTGSNTRWVFDPTDPFRSRTNYAMSSGTSFSSPYVAGIASLLLSLAPNLSASRVTEIIRASARPLEGLGDKIATGGIADAAAAVGQLIRPAVIPPTPIPAPAATPPPAPIAPPTLPSPAALLARKRSGSKFAPSRQSGKTHDSRQTHALRKAGAFGDSAASKIAIKKRPIRRGPR